MRLKFLILAMDGLEFDFIEKYGYKNLMQDTYGKTDISEFTLPRSMILWSSFITGSNRENELVAKGDFWHVRMPHAETMFALAENPLAIDVPGYSYVEEQHDRERADMKKFFEGGDVSVEEYDKHVFAHHLRMKEQFFKALEEDKHDFIMAYFSVADVIGHLSFGVTPKMRLVYEDLSDIVKKAKEKFKGKVLILSDHGMYARGRFGDHTSYGFWSANFQVSFKTPRLPEFFNTVKELIKGD